MSEVARGAPLVRLSLWSLGSRHVNFVDTVPVEIDLDLVGRTAISDIVPLVYPDHGVRHANPIVEVAAV